MPCDKRRIIEVFFPFKEDDKIHPAVILSVPEVFWQEEYYICAMLTSSSARDGFSFPLLDSDTTHPLPNSSQIRTQLLAKIYEEDINKDMPINYLKKETFQRLIDHIDEKVFGLPYEY
jgi:hypothetical protein